MSNPTQVRLTDFLGEEREPTKEVRQQLRSHECQSGVVSLTVLSVVAKPFKMDHF